MSLFKRTNAILFFGAPFRGLHEWFQNDLPMLAKKLDVAVRNDVFENFRKESSVLAELREEFIQKCHWYKTPNVGFIWEMQVSNVGKVIGDDTIPKVCS